MVSPHLKTKNRQRYSHSGTSSSDSTGLVSRLLRCWGNCRAWGGCFWENRWLRSGCWRFDLGSYFDRFCWPEGAGNITRCTGTSLESWFRVLEDLSMQRAGRLWCGCHNWGGFQWFQGVEDYIGCVFHITLPLQLPQFIQGRVHSSFNILQKEKSDVITGARSQLD